jgi:hypothetical protein
MASYRFLADAYIGDCLYLGGTTVSTADVGGTLPIGWVPGPYAEPLDTSAAVAFYNAGPALCPLVIQRRSDILITQYPATYWKAGPGPGEYSLTGLGSAFAPVSAPPMSLP